MKSKLNWGILATGHIAEVFAKGLRESKTGTLVAVGSRTLSSARQFARKFHVPKAYGSYSDLLMDFQVQAVYIGTPHSFHAKWAIAAAKAGKHILCEKPLAMSASEAMKMVQAAKQYKVFLMEAFQYRCHPQTDKVVELIRKGVIGKVYRIQASFCFDAPYKPKGRLFNHKLGGGSILDVGCYPVSFARLLAGAAQGKKFLDPFKVKGVGHIGKTGVEEWASATLSFPGEITADLLCGIRFVDEKTVRILGSKGSIVLPAPWKPTEGGILIHMTGSKRTTEIKVNIDRPLSTREADTAGEAILRGLVECPAMEWKDSLGNMKVLDAWRHCLLKR
ncbi:MAG TPA: Gfo/Idh/MocA family oxidoreductase [bacterium]